MRVGTPASGLIEDLLPSHPRTIEVCDAQVGSAGSASCDIADEIASRFQNFARSLQNLRSRVRFPPSPQNRGNFGILTLQDTGRFRPSSRDQLASCGFSAPLRTPPLPRPKG